MGTSTSKMSPLAPAFERLATWDLKASRGLLQTYKDKDMDFGLDSQGLADLLGGDKDWAETIIDAFRSLTGIINALAFVCGACLVSSGPALEKAGMIFDALDFDGTEKISMDEMTIAFLCCARGFCVMAGVGTVPSDEELESITLQAYRDLDKGSTQSITKSEFTKWLLEFASGTEAPITREVTLESALEQFRVISPTGNVEKKVDNNFFSPLVETNDAPHAQLHDENVQADDLHSHDPLQQELADEPTESAADFTVEQGHEFDSQTDKLSESVEPQLVVDEHAPSPGEGFDDRSKLPTVETEAQDTDVNEGEENVLQSETGDHKDQGGEAHVEVAPDENPEHQIANDSYKPGIEVTEYSGVAADTDTDYPTFVADVDEPPLVSDAREQNTLSHEQASELLAEAAQEAEMTDVAVQQDDTSNNRDVEPVVASDESAVKEPPSEPIAATEVENDDLLYEQDDFAQDTSRTDEYGAEPDNTSLPVENAEDTQPTEQITQSVDAPIEPSSEVLEPMTTDGEPEVTNAQDDVETGAVADETPVSVMAQDQEATEIVAPAENTETKKEALPDAAAGVTNPVGDSPRTDLNAFDTYNYQDPRFDGSSAVPPPEPQELLDNNTAAPVYTDIPAE